MRIALLSWDALYAVPVGGVGVHVSRLADALRRAGHEVHVFTRLGADQRLEDNVFGVFYHRCPFDSCQNFVDETGRMGESFAHYFEETMSQRGAFDVVHGHDWMAVSACKTICKANTVRYVQTFHTTEWGRSGVWPERGDARRIADIEKEGVAAADGVIVSSYDVRRKLDQAYQCPDWKKTVIHYGIDPKPFDAQPFDVAEVKKSVEVGPEDPTVLFVGRLSHRKGPDLLLESVPELHESVPNARILFLGEGDLGEHLHKETDRLGIREMVRFLGTRNGREVVNLYRACDCVCSASRADPFGMVTLSAWAAAKPVVATCCGAPAEMVKHEDNGLLVDVDSESIAAALRRILTDPDEMRWMGRNGRVAVDTAFTWDIVAERTLSVYRK